MFVLNFLNLDYLGSNFFFCAGHGLKPLDVAFMRQIHDKVIFTYTFGFFLIVSNENCYN
jgi:hypothetical protein